MTDTIRRPIEQELTDYSRAYRSTLSSPNSLLHAALQHIGQRAGKIMRPTLLLLCAREAGRVTPAAIHAAVGLELLHTASLVHDDVVDESDRRRGQASVNALFDNKAAVLVGDYLTSAALSQIVRTGCAEAVERTAWLGQQLADGELLQLHATDATTFSIDTYYEVIAKKTAALFATCARLGARLGGADDRQVEAMERLGHLVGLCFQLRDDLFDLDTQHDVGKPAANDLREGKLSLPYLYPLTRHEAPCTVSAVHPAPSAPTPCTLRADTLHPLSAPSAETSAQAYTEMALRVRRGEATAADFEALIRMAREQGGVAYTEQEMQRLAAEARAILATLRNPDVATALGAYLDYAVRRTH